MAVGATALIILTAAPSGAGGSWLDPTWVRVEAGDRIELSGDVSTGQLGWINDGPYYAYLNGEDYGILLDESFGGNQTDVLLGELQITASGNWADVSVAFTLPDDLPPGEYWVTACNDPCVQGFGDLIGSVLYVGMDPPDDKIDNAPDVATSTTTTTAVAAIAADDDAPQATKTTYLALAPQPLRAGGVDATWVAISAGLGLAVLGYAGFSKRQAG